MNLIGLTGDRSPLPQADLVKPSYLRMLVDTVGNSTEPASKSASRACRASQELRNGISFPQYKRRGMYIHLMLRIFDVRMPF